LHGGIVGRNQIGGVPLQARKFKLADDDPCIGHNSGDIIEEKILMADAVVRLHGRGGEGDDAGWPEFFCDSEGDGPTQGVAGKNGPIRDNQAACRKPPNERGRAGFSLGGSEGARGVSVASQIGDIHAEALFSESAAEVLHDDAVCGEAMEENDGAQFGGGGQISAFEGNDLHAARGGVDDVAFFGIAAGGKENNGAAEQEAENPGKSPVALIGRGQRKCSLKWPKDGRDKLKIRNRPRV